MTKNRITDEEALAFHLEPSPGKFEITATVPMTTQRDLSLAYSPGVAVPCEAIAAQPETAYDYTNKGNLVAVISNGTAVLGLGNLGALASKPVMEGKSVLFKRFADVNSIDIELDTEDTEAFINAVKLMGPTFGGINLEDIKAPECFIIEQRLKEEMDIPVFHDDQHGTAVICAAGLINALHISGKKIEDVRIVLNGAGAAGIACLELLKAMGAKHDNCIMCDTKGVIYQGRTEGMNQWKSAHAANTELRTLEEAMKGADVFLGVSVKGAVTQAMVESMADDPVIFAMANPDPEITPEEAREVRPDAIVATDPDGDLATVEIDGAPRGFFPVTNSRGLITGFEWTPAEPGQWSMTVIATDTEGLGAREELLLIGRQPRSIDLVVAMGDSVAAGFGRDRSDYFTSDDCWRGESIAYPAAVVERLVAAGALAESTQLAVVACSGHTGADLLATPVIATDGSGDVRDGEARSQLQWAMDTNPTIVTITAGGADAQLLDPTPLLSDDAGDDPDLALDRAAFDERLDAFDDALRTVTSRLVTSRFVAAGHDEGEEPEPAQVEVPARKANACRTALESLLDRAGIPWDTAPSKAQRFFEALAAQR